MKSLKEGLFTGERALFCARDLNVYDSVFCDGESPLKESRNIKLDLCQFKWKYPMWYSEDIVADDCVLHTTARSGIWYTNRIRMNRCVIDAPKTFRRSTSITLEDCSLPNAQETLWYCKDIKIKNVTASGDYFGLSAENVYAEGLTLSGNYAFDGAKNVVIKNSRLISKDAFWNCENVTVFDSVIYGEYLGWNSKNVTLINCTVESNQGMCYMEGLRMERCKLINTDLSFEYSSVDATIDSNIVSVKNPTSGRIVANKIDEIIIDENSRASEPVIIEERDSN